MLWYLATPYTKYHAGLDAAAELACQQAGLLVKSGIQVYSPIAATHWIAKYSGIDPLDHSFWISADAPFMDRCDGLILLMAQGWRESQGMEIERDEFKRLGKPVVWMTPSEVPAELVKGKSAAI